MLRSSGTLLAPAAELSSRPLWGVGCGIASQSGWTVCALLQHRVHLRQEFPLRRFKDDGTVLDG
eukprot:scaffold139_cov325-Pavlova_lutheri.AAC.47